MSSSLQRLAEVLLLLVIPKSRAGPFPKWSFQHPSSRMEWNIQHPIRVCVQETLREAEEYDCIVIGLPREISNATGTDHGWLFQQVDAKYSDILTQWIRDSYSLPRGILSLEDGKHHHRKGKLQKFAVDWDELSQVCTASSAGYVRAQRLVLCQIIGDPSKHPRKLGGLIGRTLASKMKDEKGRWVFLFPPSFSDTQHNQSPLCKDFLTEMITALWLDLYKDYRFKTSNREKRNIAIDPQRAVRSLDLVWDRPFASPTIHPPFLEQAMASIAKGESIASGGFLTRDIVNAPHSILNPLSLADVARRLAAEFPRLSCKILNAEDCDKLNMGAFLEAARGSDMPPQFIHLIYQPPSDGSIKRNRKLGIVGKGLLYDTGGYDVKRGMIGVNDICAAASILGAAKVIAHLGPENVEVHFVVAACEKVINDKSLVPGDIVTASNGKTIEVLNTDAEGRLTVADALVYVDKKLGCDEIVAISTVIDPCDATLSHRVACLWCKSNALAASLVSVSEATGEQVWRMPTNHKYRDGLKSEFADLNNVGNKNVASAISAAHFLQEFVRDDKPFAHIDMTGLVWAKQAGATGWGTRLVTEWICQTAKRLKDSSGAGKGLAFARGFGFANNDVIVFGYL